MKVINKATLGSVAFLATGLLGAYAAADVIGLWTFDGTVGDSVPVGTTFSNKVDPSKYPITVRARYSDEASSSHLSSYAAFDGVPFDAYRQSKFGTDVKLASSLHIDGREKSTGCPLYLDDPDGGLAPSWFTLEFFVRKPNDSATGWEMLCSRWYHYSAGQGNFYNGLFQIRDDSGKWWWYLNYCYRSGESVKNESIQFDQPKSINDGKWHLVALRINGEACRAVLEVDHVQVGETKQLQGQIVFDRENGGETERHPWVFGNCENFNGYSWGGEFGVIRLSRGSVTGDDRLWQGSSLDDGDALLWMPFDSDYKSLGWTHDQSVIPLAQAGTLSFSPAVDNVRIVDGAGRKLRGRNNGCLSFTGGYVDLKIAPFCPSMYPAITIEFFIRTGFGKGSWLSSFAIRHDTQDQWGYYLANRLPVCMQENGGAGMNIRCDTPTSSSNTILVPAEKKPFDNMWHHVAITIENVSDRSSQKVTAYFDYEKIGDMTCPGAFQIEDYHFLRIGQKDKADSTGMIDELRISKGALGVADFLRLRDPLGMALLLR